MKKQIVNNSKENWRKVLNELESELNIEYSIAILDMYDGKEERYNKTIADMHEILEVFIQEKENERSVKIVNNYNDVIEEIKNINKEIKEELVIINNKLEDDMVLLAEKFKCKFKKNIPQKDKNELKRRMAILDNRIYKTIDNSFVTYEEFMKPLVDIYVDIYKIVFELKDKAEKEENKKEFDKNKFKEIKNRAEQCSYLKSYREIEKFLKDNGFKFDKVGRHHNFINEFGDKIPVPCHSKDLGKGISKAIIKEVNEINKNRGIS